MASGIDYLAIVFITIIVNAALERAFDGGIVVFDKVVLEVLEYEGRFAWRSWWDRGMVLR